MIKVVEEKSISCFHSQVYAHQLFRLKGAYPQAQDNRRAKHINRLDARIESSIR